MSEAQPCRTCGHWWDGNGHRCLPHWKVWIDGGDAVPVHASTALAAAEAWAEDWEGLDRLLNGEEVVVMVRKVGGGLFDDATRRVRVVGESVPYFTARPEEEGEA